MNHKIPCEVIRDLLPLYADGLTSEASGQEIREHLEQCGECREMYQRMKKDVEGEGRSAKEEGQIDYLKKVRRRNVRSVLAGAAAVFLLTVSVLFVKLFIIGLPADSYMITYTNVDHDRVQVGGVFYNSASVYSRYKVVSGADGKDRLVIYACLASPWNRSGSFNLDLKLPQLGRQMDINGITVKGDGTVVSRLANDLYAARNPYVGNMSANGKLAGLLGIGKELGSFKNELQTTKEPYGWTMKFEDSTSNSAVMEEKMRAYSCVLIALTGNLGQVDWTYTVELESGPAKRCGTITEMECSRYAGAPVKSFGDSPEKVQELLDLMGIGE